MPNLPKRFGTGGRRFPNRAAAKRKQQRRRQRENERQGHGSREYGHGHRRWRRMRERQLQKEPLCQACKKVGVIRAGTDVDHIDGDAWNNAESNFQTLCRDCHNHKSAMERTRDKRGRFES